MWEISSGQPPFADFDRGYDHDYYLLIKKIIDGMRPRIVPETPSEYEKLMKQCWDADPSNRPDIYILFNKIREINQICNQNTSNENKKKNNMIKKFFKNFNLLKPFQPKTNNNLEINEPRNLEIYHPSNESSTSEVHQSKNLPKPTNAIEGKSFYLIFYFF